MNPILPLPTLVRRCLALVSAFVFATLLHAQTGSTGTIEGRVFDSTRGIYLENAKITVDGLKTEAFTDATGQYRLSGIPAGTVTVRYFFTGRSSVSQVVTVAPNQAAQQDVTFSSDTGPAKGTVGAGEPIRLDTFSVSSSKEMDAASLAINEQRFAKNITNVVSADEFGTIADGSVGEFMKFLPGITSDYTGGDARRFSINGVSSANVPISMGGFDMASAAGAGTGRQVELDQVSIASISRIEINRSPTPEQPGSALAGSVNFVPKSAFERSKPLYTYSIAFLMKDAERAFMRETPGPGWGEKSYKIHPGFDVSASVPVNKNFGFTISAGYSMQYTPQANQSTQWRGAAVATNSGALPNTTSDNPYLTNYSWRDSGKDTTRYSIATTIDWRLPWLRNDRFSFAFSYAYLREHFATRVQNIIINRVNPGAWGPTFTHGTPSTFSPTANANNGQIEMVNSGRVRPGRTIMPSLSWRHTGPIWKADSGVSYSTSRIQYLDIDDGAFNNMIARRTNVTINFDDIFYLRPGKFTVTDPSGQVVDPTKLNSYSLVSANSNRQKSYDTKRQAFGNLGRDFMVRNIPVSLKVGADVRDEARDRTGTSGELYNWVGADGRTSTTPATTAGLANDDSPLPFLDDLYSKRMPDFGLPQQQHMDDGKLWQFYQKNPNYFTRVLPADHTNRVTGSNFVKETVYAAFLRGDAAFLDRRLRIVTGLRAEQTNVRAEAGLNDPTRNFQRDAAGKVILGSNNQPLQIINSTTDPLGAIKLTAVERGSVVNKEYLRLFPSFNAGYNVTENFIVRGSYYQTVGRPDFDKYIAGVTLPNTELANSATNRITIGNANLKAWQASTYMVRAEYYFAQGGQISVAGFIRDYTNAFVSRVARPTQQFLEFYGLDPNLYDDYDVSTFYNANYNIRMNGVEFDYKQALTFLPRWARGVNVFLNVSSQRAKDAEEYFQDMNPFVCNWGVNYTRSKFNFRVNWNYRGLQRRNAATGTSIEPGTYTYRSKRLYIDVSGEYNLSRHLGLFFALRNVSDATEDTKVYGPHTPSYAKFRQRDDYAALWTAGIKGSF
jgi:iron complex outermembrane receptor protein